MKKSRSENIIMLVFSLFVIVLGVLQLKGVIDFNDDTGILKDKPKLAGAIILCLGIFVFVFSSIKEIRGLKYRKSAYHTLVKMNDSDIENRLAIVTGDCEIVKKDGVFKITINHNNGYFELFVDLTSAEAKFTIDDENEYERLSEIEKARIDDMQINMDVLNDSAVDILNKFVNFILTNK